MSKKAKGPTFTAISWAENGHFLSKTLLTEVEKDKNRKVLVGKRPGESTSGDSKIKAGWRIAAVILPEQYALNSATVGKRCADHWESLRNKYKELAKRLRKTGEGVKNDEDELEKEKDEFLDSYVGPNGPDSSTSAPVRNIWEEIVSKFPLFPRLHVLLSSRANITPPQITTGVGPSGLTVLHLQVDHDTNDRDEPSLVPLQNSTSMTAIPPDSPPWDIERSSFELGESPRPEPSTQRTSMELATQDTSAELNPNPSLHRIPSDLDNPMLEEGRVPVRPRPSTFGSSRAGTVVPIGTPTGAFQSAVTKARAHAPRSQKRSTEDRIIDMHEKVFRVTKKAKRASLQQSSREIAVKEREQLLKFVDLGVVSPESARKRLREIDDQTGDIIASSPPSSPVHGEKENPFI